MHGKGGGDGVIRYMEFLHLETETKVTENFSGKKWHEAKENKMEIFLTSKNQIQRYF
jgi:hypothetical protein